MIMLLVMLHFCSLEVRLWGVWGSTLFHGQRAPHQARHKHTDSVAEPMPMMTSMSHNNMAMVVMLVTTRHTDKNTNANTRGMHNIIVMGCTNTENAGNHRVVGNNNKHATATTGSANPNNDNVTGNVRRANIRNVSNLESATGYDGEVNANNDNTGIHHNGHRENRIRTATHVNTIKATDRTNGIPNTTRDRDVRHS